MIFDDITITAYDSDHWRIARLNRLRGAFGARIGFHDGELVERTGLLALHDHKGHLESVWATDVDEKFWASVLSDLWQTHFGEGDITTSALSTDVGNKRAAYYVNSVEWTSWP